MSSAFVVRRSEIPVASSRKIATCSLNVRKRAAAPGEGLAPEDRDLEPVREGGRRRGEGVQDVPRVEDRALDVSSVAEAFSIEVTTAAVVVASSSIVCASRACSAIEPLVEVACRDSGADERQSDETGEGDADDPEHEKAAPARRRSTPSSVIGGW